MITNNQIIIRLVLAALIGGMIGVEREFNNRPAGLRTHVLVTLGSTLFMMVSIDGYANLPEGIKGDPYRIAAQVVSGIGFLGAGTIIKTGTDIKGLTTAASLWVSAGIGLAVGTGYYVGAIVTVTIVMITLISSRLTETRIFKKGHSSLVIKGQSRIGIDIEIGNYLRENNITVKKLELTQVDEDLDGQLDGFCVRLFVKYPRRKNYMVMIQELEMIEGIDEVKYERVDIKY